MSVATSPSIGPSDVEDAAAEIAALVRASDAVVPVGARTHWEVGGPPPAGIEVRAPSGIVAYDPAELTVTVAAGMPVAVLRERLAEHGQEVVLDPRDEAATVGGAVASGLSGLRRLRYGPLRDVLLEVRFVTGDGRAVKAGGPTVKNVTGYDLPRLLVGSLGTLGVIVQVTLRCRPLAPVARWFRCTGDAEQLRARLYRPSAIVWDGTEVRVLLEGHAADVDAEARAGALTPAAVPTSPTGAHRGRISVSPAATTAVAAGLARLAVRWQAEIGVGTVHVAADEPKTLAAARGVAESAGGWLLREAGAPDLDGFGSHVRDRDLHARIKHAFDPDRRLSPGRVPW
jgi:glycolate oxidase FAD binding subunit